MYNYKGYGYKVNRGVKGFENVNSNQVIDYFENDRVKVIQNDICKNIPEVFNDANAIFSIIPWIAGYNNFTKETIADDTTYYDYLQGVSRLAKLGKPMFIACSKQAFMKQRLNPDRILYDIDFSEYPSYKCTIFIFNYDDDVNIKSTDELRDWMCKKFNCVLDFSCGYAYNLRDCASKNNCKLVLADINYNCLNEIIEDERKK